MTTPPSDRPSTAALLGEHVGWLRELARHLCADAHLAEDLAQEACVAALEAPPRDASKLRPWLAAVLRNELRQRTRGGARRDARERSVAREEALEATDRLVERVALERELVGHVLALAEPYRTAILWRFFEDLPPREIARRLGVPVNTIHSRVARGLERLRERLDERGGRSAWVVALLPLASPPAVVRPSFPIATLGGLLVNAKITLLVVSLLAAGTLATLAALRGSAPEGAAPPAAPALAGAAPAAGPLEQAPGIAGEGRLAGVAPSGAPGVAGAADLPAPAAAEVEQRVRGRVLDAQGIPLGGIELALEEEPATRTRSGAGGLFEARTKRGSATIVAATGGLATVRAGLWSAGSSYEPVVVVAPAIDLAGLVEDERGTPLSAAGVAYALPAGFDTRFADILEASGLRAWSARSDELGRFSIARAPLVAGATLRAVAEGYAPGRLAVPDASDPALRIVLRRPEVPLSGALRGRVVDADGRPVAVARVAAGLASTVSDEDGRFTIDLARAVTALSVTAVKAGHRPARLDLGSEEVAPRDELVLRLGPPPLSIAGVVRGRDGEPIEGLRVWIGDPTPFGLIGLVPMQSESLAAGAPVPKQAIDSVMRLGASDGDSSLDFTLSPRPSDAFWHWVATDAKGRFEIGGLDDRRYVLKVYDPRTGAVFPSDPIRAGDRDARIDLPAPKILPVLAGRIADAAGSPVAGVEVRLYVSPFGVRSRFFGGTVDIASWEPRETAVTGSDGRFSFADVPADAPFFELVSDAIAPLTYRLRPEDDPAALEVEVETRCHLEVRLKPPHARADAAAFRDAGGRPLDVIDLSGGGVNVYSSTAVVDGRSGVVSVACGARTLVLLLEGREVEAHPIELRPGGVQVLEP